MTNKQIEALSKEEARKILDALYERHMQDNESGVYEITSDKELGDKVAEL